MHNSISFLENLVRGGSATGAVDEAAESSGPGGVASEYKLDNLDLRVLLACGVLPTPGPEELPVRWKREYRRLADLMVACTGLAIHEAEALALRDIHGQMLIVGEIGLEAEGRG